MFVRSTPCSSCVCIILLVRDATRLLRVTAIGGDIEVLVFFRSVLVKQILNQKIQVAYIVFLKYVILKEKTLEDIFKD